MSKDLYYVSQAEVKFVNFLNGKAGPYNHALFTTIMHADYLNLQKLFKAFPDEVSVVTSYKNVSDYVDDLMQRYNDSL